MRLQTLVLVCAGLAACVADDGVAEDPVEDLGGLDTKADKITTRNITLRPHLASGAPSRRTFTITTAKRFRVSLAYEPDAQTRLIVTDDAGTLAESPVTWQPTVVVPEASTARELRIRIESSADTEVRARLHVATPDGRSLRIATFNIRWYGLGGDVDAPAPEHRNPLLRAFMAEHLADAEVIVFEEIVDVDMLRAELVPADWTCASYTSSRPEHQFVVVCHAPELMLTREADDTNLAYEPLAMGTLRPGLAGVLRDVASGAPLARIMGVHLKALPSSTDQRLAQARIITERLGVLAAANEQLPTVIIGDFNTHRAVDTGRDRDDWDLIGDVFATRPELGLVHVEHAFTNTFRDKQARAFKLDHMWIATASASNVDVAGPCNLTWETDRAAIERHFDTISDHCPLVASVTLP
jgi:hypothetical protein